MSQPMDFDTSHTIFTAAIELARSGNSSILDNLLFSQNLIPANANHKIFTIVFYWKKGPRSWSYLCWRDYQNDEVFPKLFKKIHPELDEYLTKYHAEYLAFIKRSKN